MRTRYFTAAALLLCCCAMFVAKGPALSPAFATYGDSLNLYILRAIHDPKAFPLDPAAAEFRSYASRPTLREYPYFQVYRLMQKVFPLDASMKLLSLALALATALLFLKICLLALPEAEAPWAALLLLAVFLSMDTFYYGQNRTFGAALCAAWFLLALSGRGWLSPLFALLMFAFYPYLSAAILAYSALYAVFERDEARRNAVKFAVIFALAGAAMLLMAPGPDAARDTAAVFAYKLRGLFGENVSALNPLQAILYFIFNLNEQDRLFCLLQTAAAGLAAYLAATGAKPTGMPPVFQRRLKLLAAAHTAAFLLLYPVSPFFASRQFTFFIPFVSVLLLAALVNGRWGGHVLKAATLMVLASFVLLHPGMGRILDYSVYKNVYSRLKSERAGLVAGPPDSLAMAGVPLYSGAAVFYNRQIAETWRGRAPGFDFSGRKGELEAALCSADPRRLVRFAEKTGVTHFLAETAYYSGGCPGGKSGSALLELALRHAAPDAAEPGNDIYIVDPREIADHAGKKI